MPTLPAECGGGLSAVTPLDVVRGFLVRRGDAGAARFFGDTDHIEIIGGVGDIHDAVDHRGNAGTRATTRNGYRDFGIDRGISFGPVLGKLIMFSFDRARTFSADNAAAVRG